MTIGSPSGDDQLIGTVADTLDSWYRLQPAKITRIPAGTATINFHVVDHCGDQWFAKVYRDRMDLDREWAAIELAEFARTGGVPVPCVARTREGKAIEDAGPLPMSVWQYVSGAETAESGITGGRWRSKAPWSAGCTAGSPITPQPRPRCAPRSAFPILIKRRPASTG